MPSKVYSVLVRLSSPAFLVLLIFLVACNSPSGGVTGSQDVDQPTETQRPSLKPSITPSLTTTATPKPTIESTLKPTFTTTAPPEPTKGISREARTGLPQVDTVIEAVLGDDLEDRQALVRYVTSGCTTADGLGGPPKCADGQAEGTPLEHLPLGGPGEGSYVLAAEIDRVLGFETDSLFAAYRVTDDLPDDPEYPFGAYALIFTRSSGEAEFESMVIRVDEEGYIVRLDYLGAIPPDFYFQQIAANLSESPPESQMFSPEAAEILVYPPEIQPEQR